MNGEIKVDGQDIMEINTLKSMYDGDCVQVCTKKGYYRLPTSVILQMVNEFDFEIKKKKVHEYLIKAIKKETT